MKNAVSVFSLILVSMSAEAAGVECVGRAPNGADLEVSIAKALKTRISGVVVTADDQVISRKRGIVLADPNYIPTVHKGFQRFDISSESDDLRLLLPREKSGRFVARLQRNIGTAQASTARLNCSAE